MENGLLRLPRDGNEEFLAFPSFLIANDNNHNNYNELWLSSVFSAQGLTGNTVQKIESNQHISNNGLVFDERGKPEHLEINLSEQSREPTNSTHVWRRVWESNPGSHWWAASALTTAPSLFRFMSHCSLALKISNRPFSKYQIFSLTVGQWGQKQ